jgi:hypothetical protein
LTIALTQRRRIEGRDGVPDRQTAVWSIGSAEYDPVDSFLVVETGDEGDDIASNFIAELALEQPFMYL